MEKQRMKTFRMVFLAMMVAIGVVISPILRIEGMCPTAHLINITCSVFMGPWYSLLCACMIGVIRMMFAVSTDGCSIRCLFIRCLLPGFKGKNHLCCPRRDFWYWNHWFPGILSGHGIFNGKRRIKCFLLYPNVYLCHHHGWYCSLCILKGVKPDGNACKISGKSWCKSL